MGRHLYLLLEKKDSFDHGFVTVVTEVGKRKTEDAGVRERQSERDGTRKYTHPK